MAEAIKVLDDRTWLLKRPHNIIGSMQPIKQEAFLYNDNKFNWTTYEHVPGLVKIINEIIDNSTDVAIKSKFKWANEINIEVSETKVTVSDNGYGIPTNDNADGVPFPAVAWGQARAGSNFEDDEKRVSAGVNGIGSFATVVFSKKFVGVTDDGKGRVCVTFKDNMNSTEIKKSKSIKRGTSVSFFPDLEKFGLDKIDDLHRSLIYQRVLNLSVIYPGIKFKFNKRLVKLDAKKFMGMFSDTFEFIEEENYLIGVFPNEAADFSYHTYVNGLWLEKGGNHVNFLTGKIIDELKNRLIRRYKSIKPGDIKNKLSVVIFFRNFPNAKFDGQTKEFLTNTQKDITGFLDFHEPVKKKDWERFTLKLYKNKEIISPITDLYAAKMLVEEKKKLKAVSKKKEVSEKYWPASKENKYLFLAEGDSAIGAITAELGRDRNGFMPLRGVILNVVKDRSKIVKNAEIQQIANILEMDLSTKNNSTLSYENVVFAVDADVDGAHIAGLLIGLFKEFAPSYLEDGRLFLFITPIITIRNKKGQYRFMFSMGEYQTFRDKYDNEGNKYIYDYKKGLGSMIEEEWTEMFKQFQLEQLLRPLHIKESSEPENELKELHSWLADDVDFRKEKITNHIATFDINKI